MNFMKLSPLRLIPKRGRIEFHGGAFGNLRAVGPRIFPNCGV
jgi:hypothetical protein